MLKLLLFVPHLSGSRAVSRVKDCDVGIGPRPTLGVRVGVEVIFSLLFVPHRSGFWAVRCINMLEYPHPLS